MMARADRQQLGPIKLPAKRGEIVDRNGNLLAYSVDADTIGADPDGNRRPGEVAARVCARARRLRRPAAQLDGGAPPRASTVRLSRASGVAGGSRRVKALDLAGPAVLQGEPPLLSEKELAAHVLGYVGIDNVGLAGLESTFEARIRGREGKMLLQTDARRRAIRAARSGRRPPATVSS